MIGQLLILAMSIAVCGMALWLNESTKKLSDALYKQALDIKEMLELEEGAGDE